MRSVAIEFSEFTEFGRKESYEAYSRRQRGRQKDVSKRAQRTSNRALKLDNRSSHNGVNGGRARRIVETDGSAALALDWHVDDHAFTVSEDLRRAFIATAGLETAYKRDGHNPARFHEDQELQIRIGGTLYDVTVGRPRIVGERWYAPLHFALPSEPHFAVSLAQLAKVMVTDAPALVLVPKVAALPLLTDSLAFYGRWMAGLTVCAKPAFAKQADNVETVVHTPCIGCGDMPMTFIAAGEVIEHICSVCGE